MDYRLDQHKRRIYYLEQGQGDTVVLLHGNGANAGLYRSLIEDLAQTWRVLAPDLPGYGRSVARYPLSLESYLSELEDFILAQVEAPFVLIGHSLGGFLAYQLQLRGRLPVKRAVWMEAAIFDLDWRLQLILPGFGLLHGLRPHSRLAIEQQMRKLCWDFDGGNHVSREAFISNYLRCDRQVQALFFATAPSLLPYRFDRIETEVLCLRGEKDHFVSRATDWFTPQLPRGRRQVIERAGHFLIDENNQALHQAIRDFITQTAPAFAGRAV